MRLLENIECCGLPDAATLGSLLCQVRNQVPNLCAFFVLLLPDQKVTFSSFQWGIRNDGQLPRTQLVFQKRTAGQSYTQAL